MRKMLLTLCALSIVAVGAAQGDGWYSGDQWQEASELARQEGRPLLTVFVHQGCPACAAQDYNLRYPQAQQAIEPAVKVRVEFTQAPLLDRQFNVDHTPTTIISSAAYGGEMWRQVGTISVDQFKQLGPSIRGLIVAPAPKAEKVEHHTRRAKTHHQVEREEEAPRTSLRSAPLSTPRYAPRTTPRTAPNPYRYYNGQTYYNSQAPASPLSYHQ